MMGGVRPDNAEGVDWISDAPMPPPSDGFQQPSPFQMGASPMAGVRNPYDPRFQPPPSQYPQSVPSFSPASISTPASVRTPASHYQCPTPAQSFSGASTPQFGSMNQMLSPRNVSSQGTSRTSPVSPTPSPGPQNELKMISVKEIEKYPQTVHIFPDNVSLAVDSPKRIFAAIGDEDDWCQVTLYEHSTPDSKVYQTKHDTFWVDGYCSTNRSNRFSIGAMNTPGQKSSNYRSQIGKGIRVETDDFDCYVINEGIGTIFIQCPNFAKKNGDSDDTVYRISGSNEQPDENRRRVKVFDYELFKNAFDSANNEQAIQSVYNLCITRISFLKGFGTRYPRQTIYECPVWVEMHHLKRFYEVDEKNQSLHPPLYSKDVDLF